MSQQVRWYDYPPEEDSWEAEENIFDTKLIRAFEASFKGAPTAPDFVGARSIPGVADSSKRTACAEATGRQSYRHGLCRQRG